MKFVYEEDEEEKEEVEVKGEETSDEVVMNEEKHSGKEEVKGHEERKFVVAEEMVATVGETIEEQTVDCSREVCTKPTLAASAYSAQLVFWRPWEDISSSTTVREEDEVEEMEGVEEVEGVEVCSSEATALSSLPITPPVLVTPQRRGRRRGEGRSERRLLAFQFKLQKERGLPPSRRQMEEEELKKLRESEPASRTFTPERRKRMRGVCGATTPPSPVSHSTDGRRGVPTLLTYFNT